MSKLTPFLLLAVAAGAANVVTQTPPDADRFAVYGGGLLSRLDIAARSLIFYLSKTVLPLDLSAYYDIDRVGIAPYQLGVAGGAIAGAVLLLVKRPDLRRDVGFGALFFLLTVAPTLKLVPFGGHSLFNDRYMYLPSIGLFLVFATACRPLMTARWRPLVLAGWAGVLIAFSLQSAQRVTVWRDSGTFWHDVLQQVPGTPVALNNLGRYYLDERDDREKAQESFEAAVRERPDYAAPHYNLGVVHQQRGNWKQAARAYERAVEIAPDDVEARIGTGAFYVSAGDWDRAVEHLETAAAMGSGSALAFYNLGVAHFRAGRPSEAEQAYRSALDLRPDFAEAWASLGDVQRAQRRPADALASYERAAELGYPLDPDLLSRLRRRAGR